MSSSLDLEELKKEYQKDDSQMSKKDAKEEFFTLFEEEDDIFDLHSNSQLIQNEVPDFVITSFRQIHPS